MALHVSKGFIQHTYWVRGKEEKPLNFPELLEDAMLCDIYYQDSEINGTKPEPSEWTPTGGAGGE